ncbi:MAG: aldehyde dehydrogenase family protein [Chthoniobacter sp.]
MVNGRRAAETVTVHNPATGEKIADVTRADAATVHRAIEGAAKAQRAWRDVSAVERGDVLKRTAALLLARKDEFARLLTAEQGKPYAQSVGEIEYAASFFQWFGEEARRVYGRIAAHPEAGREFFVEHRAAGVAGLITPWNFPIAQGAKKVAASLAAGCSAVWKPAELTPLIRPRHRSAHGRGRTAGGRSADRAGAWLGGRRGARGASGSARPQPHRLHGDGQHADGRSRARHQAGLVGIGRQRSLHRAARCRSRLHCGATHPLETLVSGQVCVTANRVFVHADIESALTEKLAARLEAARVGNGLAESMDAGPLIHRQACTEVGAVVDQAVAQGARIVAQNRSYESDDSLRAGSFFPPTLLTGVRDDMKVARDEIFGPVISLLRYTSVTEAVRRANETPHGLAAYVYGPRPAQCHAIARGIEAGIVGVNEWRPLKAEIPFGGIKQSGIGVEGGEEGLREFLEIQVISMPKPIMQPT